jgi:hypothetical protein
MGPKNPDAGMPPRNLPDKPGNFAEAWEAHWSAQTTCLNSPGPIFFLCIMNYDI